MWDSISGFFAWLFRFAPQPPPLPAPPQPLPEREDFTDVIRQWQELVETLQKRVDESDEETRQVRDEARQDKAELQQRLDEMTRRQEVAANAELKYRQGVTRKLREADEREQDCRKLLGEARREIDELKAKVGRLERLLGGAP